MLALNQRTVDVILIWCGLLALKGFSIYANLRTDSCLLIIRRRLKGQAAHDLYTLWVWGGEGHTVPLRYLSTARIASSYPTLLSENNVDVPNSWYELALWPERGHRRFIDHILWRVKQLVLSLTNSKVFPQVALCFCLGHQSYSRYI